MRVLFVELFGRFSQRLNDAISGFRNPLVSVPVPIDRIIPDGLDQMRSLSKPKPELDLLIGPRLVENVCNGLNLRWGQRAFHAWYDTTSNLVHMSFLIYGLVDPNTQQLRYVGKSCSGLDRPRWHWTPSGLKERTKKAAWVKSLRFADQTPEVVVLEECSDAAELAESEIFWIQYFRMIGCNLTNMTGGGDGCAGCVVSQETRNKISSAQIGKKISSEQRRKISDARGITPEVEDRVRELFVASELGASKIASTVGISKRTVFLIAKRLNLYRPPNWKSRSVQEKKLTARKLRSEGLSLAAIGKQLGVSGSRVCVWCKH